MNQCIVSASASNFNLPEFIKTFQGKYNLKSYQEIVYLEYDSGHVFIFPYGTLVCWYLSDNDYQKVLDLINPFKTNEIDKIYKETYRLNINQNIKISENTIYLNQNSVMSMLAISYALAQSEKLGVFEHKINELITEIQPLYQYLGKYGKIALSRNKISKKIGQLFSVRSFINLHMSILDTPDFFWEREELEPAYQQAVLYLELKPRMHALNARMGIIQELYDVLHNELQTKLSHRLEWIIIVLIFIEVILSLIRY